MRALVERIDAEQGRLDVLVNDIWGGEHFFEFDKHIWQHDLANGLKLVRTLDPHLITSHFALPLVLRSNGLVIEVTDGTADYNATRYRVNAFYDLVKNALIRLAWAQAQEVGDQATVVALTPGWMRSEEMLEHFGVTEANWREADHPALLHRRIAPLHRPRRRRPRHRPRRPPLARPIPLLRPTRPGLRLHRHRRHPPRRLALHRRTPRSRPPTRRHAATDDLRGLTL